MADRPIDFRLNYGHPLTNGLVFAGLGRFPNSNHFRDSSLFSNHGTLTDIAVPATAASGWYWENSLARWALKFDGTNDVIKIPANVNLEWSTAGSISCWIRRDNTSSEKNYIGCGYSGSGRNDYGIYEYSGQIYFSIAGSAYKEINQTVPTVGEWHHYALVWDGINLYGHISGNTPVSIATAAVIPLTTDKPFCIGASGEDTPNYFATITIADPMVWNRALSLSEISALRDPSNTSLSGLILPPKRRLWCATVGGETYSGSGTITTQKATVSGTGAHTIPTYSGSGTLSTRKPTLSGTGTHTIPTYSGSGTPATRKPTVSGAGEHTVPLFEGLGDLITRKPTLSGSGMYAGELYEGSGTLSINKPTISGAGQYSDSSGAKMLLYLLLTS